MGKSNGRGAPRWAVQPFRDLGLHLLRLMQLVHLSKKGVSVLTAMPTVEQVLSETDGDAHLPAGQRRMTQFREEAKLARREVREGFPILHAFGAITLWASLEAAIRLFVVRWLERAKGALAVEAVQKLKVRIGEYEQLDGQDRYFYILDRLEQEMSAPLKAGITRFESILHPFGLSGPVDEKEQRTLYELSQVRNCLMHRGGKADRRLVEACPWLSLRVGQPLAVDARALERYSDAISYLCAS